MTGKVGRWMVEGGAPNALLRDGGPKTRCGEPRSWSKEFQAKDGANRANGRDIRSRMAEAFVSSSALGRPTNVEEISQSIRPRPTNMRDMT